MNIKDVYSVGTAKLSALAVAGSTLFPTLSALADTLDEAGDRFGVMDSFDLTSTGSGELKTVIVSVLGIIASLYGALMGFYVLRWTFRKVRGGLNG